MFTLSALQTVLFVLVGNNLLEVKGMFTDYWLILFSAACFANMLGLNISSAFNSAITIYILIPFLIIPQLLLAGVVVKFDKLNPTLAKQGGVPFVGEMMASRWAFEALAVNQFKDNKYEQNYYKYKKAFSISNYKKNFWKDKILGKISKIDRDLKENLNNPEIEKDFLLLKNELLKEQRFLKNKYIFNGINKLNKKDFTPSMQKDLKDFLDELNEHYINYENKARKQEGELTQKLIAQLGQDNFIALKDNYTNESLDQLMTNSGDFGDRCLEIEGRLIQRIDPVYLDPTDSNFGAAHFYAPNKRFMGNLIPTYWFNLAVIWLMSISLMVMLYFEVFKKVLDFFGNISLKKKR
jgi:hypothetical protein